MRALIPVFVVCFSLIPFTAVASERQPQRVAVNSIKPLFLTALDKGEAYGVLTGQANDVMRQVFKTDAPIDIDVKRIGEHRQPGCARLAVTTRQEAVVLPAKKGAKPPPPEDMILRYQIDYCRTGEFPAGEK
jgi:hypothetical protein